tara:strand:- start:45 stop:245 length:201 start_codon:yes stop_codon:yes gene_type:complete
MKTSKKVTTSSVPEHCNHLLECGWDLEEIRALIGASCYREYLESLYGKAYVKMLYCEELTEEDLEE